MDTKDTKATKDTKDPATATNGAKKQHPSTLNSQSQLGPHAHHRKRDPSSSEPEIKKMDSNNDSIPLRGASDKTVDDTTSTLDKNGAIKRISTSSISTAPRSPVTPDTPTEASAATADLIEGALSDFDGSDLSDLSSGSSASGSDRELENDGEGASFDDNASVESKDDDEDGDESGNGSSASDNPRPRSKSSQVRRPFAKHTKSRPKHSRRIESDSSDGDEDKHEPSKRKPGRPAKVRTSSTKSRPTLSPVSPVSPTFTAFAKKIGNALTEPSAMEGIISHASSESQPKKKTKQPDFTNIGKRDRSGRTQLFKYTALGDLETCQKLIEAGAQVNDRDYAEWTPLHEACVTGHEKVAELLIQHHADVNAPGGHMDTPLHDAAQNGHVDVVRLLLAHGANVLAKNAKGVIPIDVTDDKEVVDLLQRRQTLVNMLTGRNQAGQTMLHRACSSGSYANVADLLNQGADIHAQDNAQWTPLHEAALAGHTKVVELLLSRGADPNAQGHGNDTALHDASQNEHEEVVQLLLEYGADPDFKNAKGEKPCDVCEDDSILELLKNGARGTKKPLPRAAGSVSSSSSLSSLSSLSSKASNLSNAAAHRTVKASERSKRQKEGSADANMSDGGRSASEEKPMSRDERKMQQLLSTIRMQEQMEERKKAKKRRPKQISDEDGDDDEDQHSGKTSRSSKTNAASLSSSLSAWKQSPLGGRNGKSSNSSNRSLSNAGRNGSKRRSSRSEDRDESDSTAEKSSKPRRPVQRSASARSRIDHRYKDAAGRTQLHQWAESGDIEMVGTLLEEGADRDPKDHEGLTPLHLAAKAGNADVLVLLLAYGCNVNAQDQDKTTALHEAVRHRHTEAVRLLLQNNALPSLRDSRKRTSMDLTSSKDTEIRSLLTASLEQAELKAKERSKKRLSQMVESQSSPKHKERKTSRNSDSDEPVHPRKKISERRDDEERKGQHSRTSSSSANVAKSSSMPSISVSRTNSAPSSSSFVTSASPTVSSTPQRKSNSEVNGGEALTPLKKQKLHSRHASLTGSGSVSQPGDDDTDMRSLGGPSKKRREVDRLSDAYVGKVKIKKEREDDGQQHFRTPSLSSKSDELRRVASTPALSKDNNMNRQGRHASKTSISSTSRPSSALGMISGASIASISPPLTETSSSPPPTSLALAAQEQETLKSKKRSSQTFSSPSSYQKFADELKLGGGAGSIHQHSRQRSTSAIPTSRSSLYENTPPTSAETDLARKRAKTSSTADLAAEPTSTLTTMTTMATTTTVQVKELTSSDGPLSSQSHPPLFAGEVNEGGEQGSGRVNGVSIKKEQVEEVVDRHIPSERLIQDAQRYLPLYTVQSMDDSAGTASSSTPSSSSSSSSSSSPSSSCVVVVDRQVQLLLGIKQGTLFARYPHLHRRLVTTREKTRLWSPLSSMVSDRCAAAVKLNFEVLPVECQFSTWGNATTAMSRLKEHEKQKFLGCELYFVRLEEVMDLIRQDYGQLNESMMTIMLDIGYEDEELEMEMDVDHAAKQKEEEEEEGKADGDDDHASAKVKVEGEERKVARMVLLKEVKDEATTESLAVGRGGLAPLFISAANIKVSTSVSQPVSAPASLSNPMRTSLPKLMRVPAKMATKAMFKEMQQYRQH
ncbi:unnamed protein product [Mortierella alpina]